MGIVKARVTGHRKLHIHNTLENFAGFTKGVIEDKIKRNERDGIGFDYMTLGIMLAFDFEAKVNFMGVRYVKPWNENQRWKDKLKLVFKTLGMSVNWNKRPYTSLVKMKTFRDTIAHGKPVDESVDYETTDEEANIKKTFNLKQAWEDMVTHDEIMQAYDDTEVVWKEMYEKSGIDVNELLDQAEFAIEIRERLSK
ncbi:hypothetical protein [Bradyrhizobium sp. JYMT SZCCT0180]|uniref:hypothetical protein n=1 Tax=Bradyrhizobium sp. JYMT SZCCT0180 TaxID=2807666 RepID=UPI001BAB41C7|nr:hypothetical protein [Bradyrhizobium sp. JYMT SZCCT0180]MBR1216204.1 hypothetical protein [Bradyrhizobium sp. JYMT SZCCT0180]